jgi:hypothetical protein
MPDKHHLLEKLPLVIWQRIPRFEIRYKDESLFMKLLGRLAFFNPDFMTKYTTSWLWYVYFPSRVAVEAEPEKFGKVLAHEYVHLLDQQKYGLRFSLSYVSPQIWSLGALGAFGAFWSCWFLLFLLFLLFLAPWPSPWRAHWEARGYLMNLTINNWRYGYTMQETVDHLRDVFEGWAYYRMCWGFKSAKAVVDEDILGHTDLTEILQHENPAFRDVHDILTA